MHPTDELALAAARRGLAAFAGGAFAQTKIPIGYTGANTFVPSFVAKDKGFFAKNGLDVTLQRIPVGSTIPGALMANSLTVGTLTAPVFLAANENGIELAIIAGAIVAVESQSHGRRGRAHQFGHQDARRFQGQEGGRARRQRASGHPLQEMAEEQQCRLEGVTYVDAPFPQMGDMIKGGQINAALPVEPFVGRIVGTKVGYLVSHYPVEVADNYLESFYATSKKWADANPAAIKGFRASITEAVAFVKSNPDEAKKTQITYLGLPEAVVATLPLATYTVEVKPEQVAFWVEISREFGLLKTALKTDGLIVK